MPWYLLQFLIVTSWLQSIPWSSSMLQSLVSVSFLSGLWWKNLSIPWKGFSLKSRWKRRRQGLHGEAGTVGKRQGGAWGWGLPLWGRRCPVVSVLVLSWPSSWTHGPALRWVGLIPAGISWIWNTRKLQSMGSVVLNMWSQTSSITWELVQNAPTKLETLGPGPRNPCVSKLSRSFCARWRLRLPLCFSHHLCREAAKQVPEQPHFPKWNLPNNRSLSSNPGWQDLNFWGMEERPGDLYLSKLVPQVILVLG